MCRFGIWSSRGKTYIHLSHAHVTPQMKEQKQEEPLVRAEKEEEEAEKNVIMKMGRNQGQEYRLRLAQSAKNDTKTFTDSR